MAASTLGKVAHMLYASQQSLNFVQLVEQFHATLARLEDTELSLRWHGQDAACLDLSAVRIILKKNDNPGEGYATGLTVAVEPAPNRADKEDTASFEETCSSVVEHLQRRYPASVTLWQTPPLPAPDSPAKRAFNSLPPLTEMPEVPASGRIAPLAAAEPDQPATDLAIVPKAAKPRTESTRSLAQMLTAPDTQTSLAQAGADQVNRPVPPRKRVDEKTRTRAQNARARFQARLAMPTAVSAPIPKDAEDLTPLSDSYEREFARVRVALNTVDAEPSPPQMSIPLRLTAHAMNASLILVWAPLGIAVMAYALAMGEDLRFSSRMAVVIGLFSAALDAPISHYMALI